MMMMGPLGRSRQDKGHDKGHATTATGEKEPLAVEERVEMLPHQGEAVSYWVGVWVGAQGE